MSALSLSGSHTFLSHFDPLLNGWERAQRLLGLAAAGGLAAVALSVTPAAHAGTVLVAVAANFSAPLQAIGKVFSSETGHTLSVSSGATGKLYAQIVNGAPFEVFLSADQTSPAQLESAGLAVPATRFTYATGRLALWSATAGLVDVQGAILKNGRFDKIAIAEPKTAPYGAAAIEVMTRLDVLGALTPKLVTGESIGQAYSFVATGNAALGFVALSQVMQDGQLKNGSTWAVPANLHTPIRQDAVLLTRGKNNSAALAFMAFLQTYKTKALIKTYGYD